MRSAILTSCAALAALGFAACGDSGPSTEEEVRAAATRAIEAADAKPFCRQMVSAGYIKRIFDGDVRKCVSSEGSVPEDSGKARVTAVALDQKDETRATVAIAVSGGDLDGTAGHLEMVEEEDGWKLDDYEDDYLRSAFLAAIRSVDEGAVSTGPMKACFTRQVKALDAATIRKLNFASDSDEQNELDGELKELAEGCPHALADYGAKTLTQGLAEKRSPAFARCIRRELFFLLDITDLAPELLTEHPNFAAEAAIDGIVESAKKSCERKV